jgi:hypothetical protein
MWRPPRRRPRRTILPPALCRKAAPGGPDLMLTPALKMLLVAPAFQPMPTSCRPFAGLVAIRAPRSQAALGNAFFPRSQAPAWERPFPPQRRAGTAGRARRPYSQPLTFSANSLRSGTMRNKAERGPFFPKHHHFTGTRSGTVPEQLRNTSGTNRNICGTNRHPKRTNRNICGTFRQISGTRTATFAPIGTGSRFTRVQVALKRRAKIITS